MSSDATVNPHPMPEWMKVLIGWLGWLAGSAMEFADGIIGFLTLGEWVLAATLVYTLINTTVLLRDKVFCYRRKDIDKEE